MNMTERIDVVHEALRAARRAVEDMQRTTNVPDTFAGGRGKAIQAINELIASTDSIRHEQPSHRYFYSGDPKPGDTVLHSELLPDGTWSEPTPVTVTA